ncbi:unnamed protein product [Vicia faba]|uniref:Uncharacterized protein n=1 Tax=Vicia faba TaxID=3906 RepID=A0AAV0YZX6_VICFA|nr:unnamed protein product [Vicia faba]
MLETRVKSNKAGNVRDKLKLRGKYLDNYVKHNNGRIWVYWDENLVDIQEVKCTTQLIHCKRAKIRWLRLRNGNNAYFHASLKSKYNQTSIKKLYKNDGNFVTTQKEIEEEIMRFYGDLMGIKEPNLDSVDINIMRKGSQVNIDQRKYLIGNITNEEIIKALKSIGNLKAPGIDGYGAKFFKDVWSIIKSDFKDAIREFFEKSKLYEPINTNLVILIPKIQEAKYARD